MPTARTLRMLMTFGAAALAVGAASRAARNAAGPGRRRGTGTGTAHAADRDMQAVLDALADLAPLPIERLTPEEARRQPTPADAVHAVLERQGRNPNPSVLVPGVTTRQIAIADATGAMLPATVYTPVGPGPFPLVLYFHGGGWVLADPTTYDGGARGLAKQAQAVVVSASYRRAPEARFPAQHDDALAAWRWVTAHADELGADGTRFALAGESAGGNLALATALAARDADGPQPCHVLSVYPVAQATDLDTPSYRDCAEARPLNRAMMEWFAGHVFEREEDKADPRIDLIGARLAGLPPVTLINAEIDPLRSDGDALAGALREAGVAVSHQTYRGATHEFFGMAPVVGDAAHAQTLAGRRLRAAFEGAEPQPQPSAATLKAMPSN